MKKIVIIGANYFQNPLIEKAKELGYETHVFAWKEGAIGEKTADFFYPISIIEKERILEECKKIQPQAVVSIASDLANITVQYLAKELGLPCNSDESIVISTNKYAMRDALKRNGIWTPKYFKVNDSAKAEIAAKEMRFPLIAKPTDRSGSRGITKIDVAADIKTAVDEAIGNSFEKGAILEEYIEGEEYSCEAISYNGKHTILTVTKKYTTGYPHFIETGHLEPAPLDTKLQNKIYDVIPRALDALKIEMGASHSEFKVTPDGEIGIIEIGSRMGGDCIGSNLVRLSTGYDFVKMVIEVALGKPPSLVREKHKNCSGIKFIFKECDYQTLLDVKDNVPEIINYVSEIEEIGSRDVVDSSTRFGFFIMAADDNKVLREVLEK